MENLDLQIDNYSIKDLEKFFKLSKNSTYNSNDIELKESKIREQLLNSGHINKRFKKDLIDFLEIAKNRLIDAKCKIDSNNVPTTIPKNYKLDDINAPLYKVPNPRSENIIERSKTEYIYTQQSDFLPGNLNPLNTRVLTKCLNIDTRFRSNLHQTKSSDITLQIPGRLNKVVSMELASIELPISYYGISESYGNNFMHILIRFSNYRSPTEIHECFRKIVIPDGNYTESDLIETINYMVNKSEGNYVHNTDLYLDPSNNIVTETGHKIDSSGNVIDNSGNIIEANRYQVDICGNIISEAPEQVFQIFSFIHFKLDVNENGSGSHRVSVAAKQNPYVIIQEIILDFTKNKNGEPDNTSLYTKLGWNLGFTKGIYLGDNFYHAETIIQPATKYIYLAIDDFNNNSNSNFMSVFQESIMNNDILARISIKGNRFNLLTNNDFDIVSEPRIYFGPIDLQRLRIRLLDEHGRVLQMENSNYSFCLKLKMLYDL